MRPQGIFESVHEAQGASVGTLQEARRGLGGKWWSLKLKELV